ncbi:suppressor of fused domain protein [Ornithinimicrobium cavernae]|uniref:suppressor of fused domain protein n=1 Tax=Ornithinimicrobium cavernae TaxID=2666047 RepID=UPI000D69F737|nr:suppressor of fused domain protein [Ornithinimicrobium cavernae]
MTDRPGTGPSPTAEETTGGGDPLFRHDQDAVAPDAPAPRDPVRRAACVAHLTEFLGDAYTVLTERVSTGIQLDLLVFRPTEAVPHVTIVTAGMSDLPMNTPPGLRGDRLELMLGVPAAWPGIDPLDADLLADPTSYWPIRLLKDLARIPSTYDSFLTWGHTVVDDESALFPPGSPYSGAIVGPPVGYPADLMRAQTPVGEVEVLAVFPLTPEEMAYKVAVPGGGDALLDRLMDARVRAVVQHNRPSAVPGPPPWSVHLLMTGTPRHLGDVLDQAVPNRAAVFAEDRLLEGVVPVDDEDAVRLRLFRGQLRAAQLADDAASSPQREAVLPAVETHRSVVTLTPEKEGDGSPVMAVMALVAMLAERSDIAAVWLPHQRHVTTAGQFAEDLDGAAVVTYRVHPTEVPEGQAVITRGFAALGGREVMFSDPDRSHERLTTRLQGALASTGDDGDRVPRAGQRLRYVSSRYELVEDSHPLTREPVLAMVRPRSRGRGLFGRG